MKLLDPVRSSRDPSGHGAMTARILFLQMIRPNAWYDICFYHDILRVFVKQGDTTTFLVVEFILQPRIAFVVQFWEFVSLGLAQAGLTSISFFMSATPSVLSIYPVALSPTVPNKLREQIDETRRYVNEWRPRALP